MKQLFEQYALYNVWANERIIDTILKLPEEMLFKTVASSFSSIHLTLLHVWNADSTWWQRMKLVETVQEAGNKSSSTQEIISGLLSQSREWQNWVEKSTSAALEHEFIYRNSKKQQFKQPVYQVLLHLFNHATYHRGQLVTILRQLNVTAIPATDFILFTREKRMFEKTIKEIS